VANAGVRGRPIEPLVLSAQEERTYPERQSVVTVLRDRYPSGAARSCDVRTACQANLWLPNSASTSTPLASVAAGF
jgi:hypothetical protein